LREATLIDMFDWVIFRRLTSFSVTGNSMKPTLAAGDRVLVTRSRDHGFWFATLFRRLRDILGGGSSQNAAAVHPVVGDVVVCEHPLLLNTRIVKRVGALGPSRDGVTQIITLYGDNHICGESNRGSGLFGDVTIKACVGIVVAVIHQP